MKLFIWKILAWIDDTFNHNFIEELTNIIPVEDEEGNDTLFFIFYQKTCCRYCDWVNDLYFKWFGDD